MSHNRHEDHPHDHAHHAHHRHAESPAGKAVAATPTLSLLRMSALQRLAIAAVPCLLLWAVVYATAG